MNKSQPFFEVSGNWEIIPKCYVCGDTENSLFRVYAPGTYYMCIECIKKEENETGKFAVFNALQGLKFVEKERAKELTKFMD